MSKLHFPRTSFLSKNCFYFKRDVAQFGMGGPPTAQVVHPLGTEHLNQSMGWIQALNQLRGPEEETFLFKQRLNTARGHLSSQHALRLLPHY